MTTENRQPLDPALAELQRKWQESGIPDLYAGATAGQPRTGALYSRVSLSQADPADRHARGFRSPARTDQIPVELVPPVEGAPIGTLVFFHGGGFIIGDIDSHQAHAIRLANRARVVVLNVDYRLAPENPVPAGCRGRDRRRQWARAHLGRLGGAGKPLAVGGDSAGGNFAAVTAIKCRDAGIKLAAQVLL